MDADELSASGEGEGGGESGFEVEIILGNAGIFGEAAFAAMCDEDGTREGGEGEGGVSNELRIVLETFAETDAGVKDGVLQIESELPSAIEALGELQDDIVEAVVERLLGGGVRIPRHEDEGCVCVFDGGVDFFFAFADVL